jgi:hypothetical protein
LLIVCSNYIATLKQNVKNISQNHSPLPPPIEDKKPALPSEWSLSDTDQISTDEIDSIFIESPKIENQKIKNLFIKSRPPLDHEAFNLETYKKPVNTRMKNHVDEMVKNGTPYLAMRLSPVYRLEFSKNLILSEETKSKFPLMEKMDEIFCDGIAYDTKINLLEKEENKETPINITNLMEIINQLELDDDDDNIESIICKYI